MAIDLISARRLAPLKLDNLRAARYQGETLCTNLTDFVDADRHVVERIYAFLRAIFSRLTPPPAALDRVGPIQQILREFQFYRLLDELHILGCASYVAAPSEALAKTIHDLRGGALSSLIGHLDALAGMSEEATVAPIFFALVRDQLKIMRNSVCDLDLERRRKDLLPRAHSVELVVGKWRQSSFGPAERPVEIRVECSHPQGTISECCVESAAIDRILYNLMNNAVRHSHLPVIDFLVFSVPDATEAQSLRFVVSNCVSAQDAHHLSSLSLHGSNLDVLFAPRVSTTGSGLGLTIAAEFVANAYGLRDREEAVEKEYVGAHLVDDNFVAWFHWPLSSWRSDPASESQKVKMDNV